jgi:hypothetical protein
MDLIYLIATLAFFALTAGLVAVFEKVWRR